MLGREEFFQAGEALAQVNLLPSLPFVEEYHSDLTES